MQGDEHDDDEGYEVGKWIDATKYNLNDLLTELRFEYRSPYGSGCGYDWLMICWGFEGEDDYYFDECDLRETRELTNFGRLLDERGKGTVAIHQQWVDSDGNQLEKPVEHRVKIWGYYLLPEIPNDFFYYYDDEGNKQWT